jgi:methionyl-tRNA formyltransferase
VPQPDEGVTYARKIEKAESAIDFTKPAGAVHNHIRGLSPVPGAWFEIAHEGKKERIKVLRSEMIAAEGDFGPAGTVIDERMGIACGSGAMRCVELQRAGRKPMRLENFIRGMGIGKGSRAVIQQQS